MKNFFFFFFFVILSSSLHGMNVKLSREGKTVFARNDAVKIVVTVKCLKIFYGDKKNQTFTAKDWKRMFGLITGNKLVIRKKTGQEVKLISIGSSYLLELNTNKVRLPATITED